MKKIKKGLYSDQFCTAVAWRVAPLRMRQRVKQKISLVILTGQHVKWRAPRQHPPLVVSKHVFIDDNVNVDGGWLGVLIGHVLYFAGPELPSPRKQRHRRRTSLPAPLYDNACKLCEDLLECDRECCRGDTDESGGYGSLYSSSDGDDDDDDDEGYVSGSLDNLSQCCINNKNLY